MNLRHIAGRFRIRCIKGHLEKMLFCPISALCINFILGISAICPRSNFMYTLTLNKLSNFFRQPKLIRFT